MKLTKKPMLMIAVFKFQNDGQQKKLILINLIQVIHQRELKKMKFLIFLQLMLVNIKIHTKKIKMSLKNINILTKIIKQIKI